MADEITENDLIHFSTIVASLNNSPKLIPIDIPQITLAPDNDSPIHSRTASSGLKSILTNGVRMLKIPNKSTSRAEERLIKVDLFPLQISWESRKKRTLLSTLDFDSIREIRLGQSTKAFEIHGRSTELENRSFSIIYNAMGHYKVLNLVAPSKEDCVCWVYGLHMLLTQSRVEEIAHLDMTMAGFLLKMWKAVDVKNNEKLNLDEVTTLLRRLNINLSKQEVKSTLKSARIGKQDFITFDVFENLYRILRFRPEISQLFNSITSTELSYMRFEEFRAFNQKIQKVEWPHERMAEIFRKYSSPNPETIDMDHFSAFLISNSNSVYKKSRIDSYQNMDLPLNHYYINTSHNTYLLGDQIRGESSIEGYIRALQKGCRCIELDCWDGSQGSPVIYHGHTLTNRLPLKDVIDAIAKYAFVSSDYPLILSLEIHCSNEQQNVMSDLFRTVFAEMLVPKSEFSGESLPSPNSLKNRILLKGKVNFCSPINSDTEDDCAEISESKQKNPSPGWLSLSPVLSDASRILSDMNLERKQSNSKKNNISKSLFELINFKKTHFDGFQMNGQKYDKMFSFSERRSISLLTKDKEYHEYNRKYLTRVYPSAIRVSSSNFDPIPHWAIGSQMVAMNYQTYDKYMELNNALFAANRGCGYILKPEIVNNNFQIHKYSLRLNITILSAQQLPKPKENLSTSIIDPSIDLEVIGVPDDCSKFKTRAIASNGFNPMWREDFEFVIAYPELAFLRIQVQNSSTLVGSFSIHIPNMEEGYRHMPLFNWKGELLRFSTVFVCIRITK